MIGEVFLGALSLGTLVFLAACCLWAAYLKTRHPNKRHYGAFYQLGEIVLFSVLAIVGLTVLGFGAGLVVSVVLYLL